MKGEHSATPDALARLFTADRSEHLYGEGGVAAQANDGVIVVCDRYLYSSLAYQSIGCPFETVLSLNEAFPIPELTFFVDVPPEICAARRAEREGVELFEHHDLQDTILANYARAFAFYEGRGAKIVRLDGTPDPAAVAQNAWNRVQELPILK